MATDGAAGMVAVVRGLQDARLAVTLYDNGKEFTLAPNTFTQPHVMPDQSRNTVIPTVQMAHHHHHDGCRHPHVHPPLPAAVPRYIPDVCSPGYSQLKSASTEARLPEVPSMNAGTQVVDGRYASVYQATYCKMKPTSPPADLPEFPPQRSDPCRGGGNFVVGGSGSGDTRHRHVPRPNNYRGGGLIWPDKDSVCSPQPSAYLDPFAKSLRKYPRLSPERSSEIVERLINYTQAKNYARNPSRQCSHDQCESSDTCAPKSPSRISRGCNPSGIYDDSPTRERAKRGDSESFDSKKNYYFKNYDVRNIREVTKAIRENMSINATGSNYQNNPPVRRSPPLSPSLSLRQRSPNARRSVPLPEQSYPSMVHSEIQAAVTMVCRQVETMPRIEPPKRDVIVTCPDVEQAAEGEISTPVRNVQSTHSAIEIPSDRLVLAARKSRSTEEIDSTTIDRQHKIFAEVQDKSIRTQEPEEFHDGTSKFTSAQTAFSATDVTNKPTIQTNNINTKLKSKSQDDIEPMKDRTEDIVLECLNELQIVQKGRNAWNSKLQKLAEKLKMPGGEQKIKHKIKKYLKRFPSNFDEDDEEGQRFREQLPDYIVHKLKKTFAKQKKRYRSTIAFTALKKEKNQANLKTIVKAWIKILPLMKKDFLGRSIKKDEILESIIQKLEPFISYRPESDRDFGNMLLSYVTEIANAMPLSYNLNKEKEYMSSIVDELVENILALERRGVDKKKRKLKRSESIQNAFGFKDTETITDELEHFIADELAFILKDSDIAITEGIMTFIKMEISNIFSDAIQSPEAYKSKDTKLEVCYLLQEVGNLPELQASYFSQELVNNFKYIFLNNLLYNSRKRYRGAYSEACLVYYVPHIKFSQPPLSNKIEDINKREYAKELASCIDHWLCLYRTYLPLIQFQTFRNVAVNELTEAIINRHLYLKQHDSNRGTTYDEQEHLKYLIFKWIRKLVGEDNVEIIQHVPELLQNMQNVKTPEPNTNISRSRSYTISSIPQPVYDYKHLTELINDLYEEILEWYSDLPRCLYSVLDKKIKRNNIKQLADDIAKGLNTNASIDDLIDKEVDLWTRKVLKRLPRSLLIEELKARIKITVIEKMQIKTDSSLQTDNCMQTYGTKTSSGTNCRETTENFIRDVSYEIDQWLAGIHLSIQSRDTAKEAIKNLALDIIDRHKYLELNPTLRGTDKDELENLKYQVYKWLNRVVSKNNMKPVDHAPELMQRLQNVIPSKGYGNVSISSENLHTNNCANGNKELFCFCNCSNSVKSTNLPNSENIDNGLLRGEGSNKTDNTVHKSSGTAMEPMTLLSSRAVGGPDRGFSERHGRIVVSRKTGHSIAATDSSFTVPINSCYPSQIQWIPDTFNPHYCNNYSAFTINSFHSRPLTEKVKKCQDAAIITEKFTPEVYAMSTSESNKMTGTSNQTHPSKTSVPDPKWNSSVANRSSVDPRLSDTYEYFDQMFRKRCEELPIDESSPEFKALGENTKRVINNTIWKTFFRLKEDPSIENNNTLLVAVLDDQLDVLVDCLPQTEKMIEFRAKWKNSLITDVSRMLNWVHRITTFTSFREQLAGNFESKFFKLCNQQCSDEIQYILTIKMVDAFILFRKFKTDHPTKAMFYKQRLMKKIEDLFENSKQENLYQLDLDKFCQQVTSILDSLPIPDNETLKNEADEILMGDLIEEWYYELTQAEIDSIVSYKTKEELLKKLVHIDKMSKTDKHNTEEEMLREITEFLKKKFISIQDVNVKAKELVKKLKNIKLGNDGFIINKTFDSEVVIEKPGPSKPNVNGLLVNTDSNDSRKKEDREYTDAGCQNEQNHQFSSRSTVSSVVLTNHNHSNEGMISASASAVPINVMPNVSINRQAYIMNPREFDIIGLPYYLLSPEESIEFERSGTKSFETRGTGSSDINSWESPAPQSEVDNDEHEYERLRGYIPFYARNPRAYWFNSYPYVMPFAAPPF